MKSAADSKSRIGIFVLFFFFTYKYIVYVKQTFFQATGKVLPLLKKIS